MPAVVGPWPTLSQVVGLDTAYLLVAAGYWERTAALWGKVFTDILTRVSTPGGTPWTGAAAAIACRADEQLQGCKDGVLDQLDHRANR